MQWVKVHYRGQTVISQYSRRELASILKQVRHYSFVDKCNIFDQDDLNDERGYYIDLDKATENESKWKRHFLMT
jgi:hypothetical protein